MYSATVAHSPTIRPFARQCAPDLPPTVFVLDGDLSVREWLAELIREAGWVVRTFASGLGFLECEPPVGPSCLVLDVGLPDISGLDLQTRVAHERADMPIIFMSKYADVPMTVRAMKAGATEFLVRPVQARVLLAAIEAAFEHSRATAGRRTDLQELQERYDVLTPRERQVMASVVSGLMNKQIAFELGITEFTVKVHRRRVMAKMRARSLADLVRLGGRLELS